jgi:putative oxidoreductase
MSFKRFFSTPTHPSFSSFALLLLRVVVGIAFLFHGKFKIQNPFGWMGPDGFAPPIFQALAALSEFGGGIALILGLLTPLACLGLACTMAVAFSMHTFVLGDPFVSMTGGSSSELSAVFFCIALLLLTTGPGRFSLDRKLFGVRSAGETNA